MALSTSVSSSSGRLEYGHNTRVIEIACCDAFKMRTDAAQFGGHETVHEMQTAVEPGEQFVLDLVVNRERDLGAIWTNLREINNAHQSNVTAHRFERVLVRRVALDRQEDRMRLKTERTAKAEIDSFR